MPNFTPSALQKTERAKTSADAPQHVESPKVASEATAAAYRDIRATGAPKAVKRCWKAIAAMLPDDGPSVIDYRDIAKRAHCKPRHAIRAIAFGVSVGCLDRERSQKHSTPGDCWWKTNAYRWLGAPREPIIRGAFAAFLARAGYDKCHKEEDGKCHNPPRARYGVRTGERERTPPWTKGDAHRVVGGLSPGGRCEVCGMKRPAVGDRCRGPR